MITFILPGKLLLYIRDTGGINLHNNHTLILVSGSSASSPAFPTTPVAVVTCTTAVCSVCLRAVCSSGAVPDHGNKEI